ncbi:MAG: hypothetical protein SFW09_11625 [Hyphomicrobiaceae bacterium]|nr:hypothetical protein [Hyphomicrobiaceae bacterium]
MSFKKVALASATLLLISAGGAMAHDTAPIDRTQARQLQQIQEARRNGSLTKREYEARVAEQARIADLERRAQANGVTGREFRTIREAQRDAAANISSDANNGKVNIWRRWKSRHDL